MYVKITLGSESKEKLVLFLMHEITYDFLNIKIQIYKEENIQCQKLNFTNSGDSNQYFKRKW